MRKVGRIMGENKRGNPTAGLGSILGGIISVLFAGIIIFIMVALVEITNQDAGVAAVVFTSINLLIIVLFMFFSGEIIKKTSMVCMTNLWVITIIYTIIELGHMMIRVAFAAPLWYVLFHLILIFVYVAFASPVILSGIRQNAHKKEYNNTNY